MNGRRAKRWRRKNARRVEAAAKKSQSEGHSCIGADQVKFGHHVVALVDFVGQSSELEKWNYLPTHEGELQEFIRAAKASYGRIETWRSEFEKYFQMFVSGYEIPTGAIRGVPDGGLSLRDFHKIELKFMRFSDTIVVYSPLVNQNGYLNVTNICACITVTGTLLLASLAARQIPFRGAIEIGMAAELGGGDLYGPALARAHHCESKVADYPRVVVGPDLIQLLNDLRENQDQFGPERVNRGTADLCLQMLAQDDSGNWFVDYLNDAMVGPFTNPTQKENSYSLAYKFILDESDRFRAEGNECLLRRYGRLVDYFKSRGVIGA